MIIEYLKSSFTHQKLYNSWLIESGNIEQALKDVQQFVRLELLGNDILLENHSDYYFVTREISSTINAKNISVEQIRKLQEFLNKTSMVSGYKIAIIYGADLMNLNAANSCLKILEDTPKNSYIFLITSRAASIISTIRSRCFKINVRSFELTTRNELYSKFIQPIADTANNEDLNSRLTFLNQFSNKDRELWLDFIENILYLMNRLLKKSVGININLSMLENKIFNKLSTHNPSYLLQKFTDIQKLIHDTIDYDLDLKTSCVLIMSKFTHA